MNNILKYLPLEIKQVFTPFIRKDLDLDDAGL